MTPGSDGSTIDGMSLERMDKIIASLKDHSYQPKPARRTYIRSNSTRARKTSPIQNIYEPIADFRDSVQRIPKSG